MRNKKCGWRQSIKHMFRPSLPLSPTIQGWVRCTCGCRGVEERRAASPSFVSWMRMQMQREALQLSAGLCIRHYGAVTVAHVQSLLREPCFVAVDKQQRWNWLHELSPQVFDACSDSDICVLLWCYYNLRQGRTVNVPIAPLFPREDAPLCSFSEQFWCLMQ